MMRSTIMPLIKVGGGSIDVEQTGAGRDLVLLHSLLADRTAFERAAPLLAKTRRLTLVNLPGYGASTPAGPRVEDYADLLAGLFGALRLAPRGTDVLGNGFGGFIAVALAARHGASFDRLVVVDSLAAFPAPAKEPLRLLAENVAKQGMRGALDIAIRRMFPEPFIVAHPGIVAERKRALEKADAVDHERHRGRALSRNPRLRPLPADRESAGLHRYRGWVPWRKNQVETPAFAGCRRRRSTTTLRRSPT